MDLARVEAERTRIEEETIRDVNEWLRQIVFWTGYCWGKYRDRGESSFARVFDGPAPVGCVLEYEWDDNNCKVRVRIQPRRGMSGDPFWLHFRPGSGWGRAENVERIFLLDGVRLEGGPLWLVELVENTIERGLPGIERVNSFRQCEKCFPIKRKLQPCYQISIEGEEKAEEIWVCYECREVIEKERGRKETEENGRLAKAETERLGRRQLISMQLRFRIFERDGFKCQLCGRKAKEDSVRLEVDHRLAVVNGGTNDESNLWTLCRECNAGKSGHAVDLSGLPVGMEQEAVRP